MSDRANTTTSLNALSSTESQSRPENAASSSPSVQEIAVQQSDNVAHALAGAGGGLLSMALTYDFIWLTMKRKMC